MCSGDVRACCFKTDENVHNWGVSSALHMLMIAVGPDVESKDNRLMIRPRNSSLLSERARGLHSAVKNEIQKKEITLYYG